MIYIFKGVVNTDTSFLIKKFNGNLLKSVFICMSNIPVQIGLWRKQGFSTEFKIRQCRNQFPGLLLKHFYAKTSFDVDSKRIKANLKCLITV